MVVITHRTFSISNYNNFDYNYLLYFDKEINIGC